MIILHFKVKEETYLDLVVLPVLHMVEVKVVVVECLVVEVKKRFELVGVEKVVAEAMICLVEVERM